MWDRWMDRWKDRWMDVWKDECMEGWIYGRKDGCVEGCMEGWMVSYRENGQMADWLGTRINVRMDGRMKSSKNELSEWMNGCIHQRVID